jgi:hypothetical protein
MVAFYGQRHDLSIVIVTLVQRAAGADEPHSLFGVARDQSSVMLITQNRPSRFCIWLDDAG